MTITSRFLSGSALGAMVLAFGATPAFAQTSDKTNQEVGVSAETATTGEKSPEGEIIVTGSRIARRDLVSSSPLAVVNDEEFKLSGAVNVEQVLNALPQTIPGVTGFSNNPGGGVATLNLRGLGEQRNLVLVNGRRWMFFDTSQVVDLNTIPQFLIDSVDVVTGGASAVYGSDAIAGVVNFRLRNDLTGVEGGTTYNVTQDGDGARWDAYLAVGSEFADGRGHVTAFGEYYKRKPIFQGDRAFSTVTFGDGATGLVPGGSATTPAGRFAIPATSAVAAGGGLGAVTLPRGVGAFANALGATFTSGTSTSRPYVSATDVYNYAPANYLQVPQERFLFGAYGDYEVNDHVSAYLEVTGVNNRVVNELAATPVTGTFNINLAAVAPFLSAADNATLAAVDANEAAINAANVARGRAAALPGAGVISATVNRRITETGSRASLDERNAFRILGGVKGTVFDTGLNYDAYYSYARTRNANVQEGNISRSKFQAGLDGTAPAIDIFGPGTLSQASVDQISILAQNNDISVLQVAQASVNGSLFNFGMGGDDVGFAAGVEYRSVSSRFIPDTALSSGDVIGFNAGNPTAGGYHVVDYFGELRVPLIADRPFFQRLELTGAGRYSKYSLDAVGGVYTYAGGVEWAPIKDITFRGNYQRAVRAPNVGELFGGVQTGFPAATDPCALPSAGTNAAIRAVCIATGVPAANVGLASLQPNTQIQSASGGNPNLVAEKSDSYTFGAVVRPTFIRGLNITADYFNIKVGNAIAGAGGGVANILSLCYNTFQDASNGFCQLITRNPTTGQIDGAVTPSGANAVVFAGNANLSAIKTSGIDVSADYSTRLGFGMFGQESKLNMFFQGTWTEKNSFTPVIGRPDVVECAGFYGNICGQPQSKYKWSTRLSLIDGPLTISGKWRHLSKVRDDDDTTDYIVERIKAYNLYDISFAFDITDQITLSGGVNNLLNKTPPIVGSNQEQANTFPSVYDVLGRDFFASASFRF